MSASVDIYTKKVKDALSVPIQAVTAREREESKGNDSENKQLDNEDFEEVIFVVEGDSVNMMEVKTGIQDDEYIQILSGLDEGTKIVKGPYAAVSSKLEQGKEIHEKEDEEKDKDEK